VHIPPELARPEDGAIALEDDRRDVRVLEVEPEPDVVVE
jgi:hypothetical protein